jgi:ring-1,2-phenylacetyl-CoA epoxidase subunit PaaC
VTSDDLLALADDELILGWRNSEWTGIAPFLEEDVAFSSIAQTEVGHARAWYQLAAKELGTDADSLAFDREPDEYANAPLVELRLVPDWARTIARHWLYETADAIRIEALKGDDDPEVAGLAEKIDREEAYHRMHAQMWEERLRDEPRFQEALETLWPYAAALLPAEQRPALAERTGRELPSNRLLLEKERGRHGDDLQALWEEMTMVRRSVPGAAW